MRPWLASRHVLLRSIADLSCARWIRAPVGWVFAGVGWFLWPVARDRARSLLLWAHRCHLFAQAPTYPTRLQRLIEQWIRSDVGDPSRSTKGPAAPLNPGEARLLRARGIVLKSPATIEGRRERGVLLIKFTEQFSVLRRAVDPEVLSRDYTLVLEPSFSGYADTQILGFLKANGAPVLVFASEERDLGFLQRIGGNLVPVSLGSGDWVNPELYRPLPDVERQFDAVMVAGWRPFKRHHVLLRAVRRLRDPGYRLALVGDASDRKPIEQLVRYYGVDHQVHLIQGIPPERVNWYYNAAAVNLLLSLREGSNKAISEGFFADTPAIALQNVLGPARQYFNESTGMLIVEHELPEVLREFQRGGMTFSPRRWALANISPTISTTKLNEVLKKLAAERGEPWTQDIVGKENRPELHYLDPADKGKFPSMEQILNQYSRSSATSTS